MKGSNSTSILETHHRTYLSRILGFISNGHDGIDLKEPELQIGIELKTNLAYYLSELDPEQPKKRTIIFNNERKVITRYSSTFSPTDFQYTEYPKQNPEYELYWAFMYYALSRPIEKITDRKLIEDYILERTTYILPWNILKDIPINKAKFDNYRYVKKRLLEEQDPLTRIQRGNSTFLITPNAETIIESITDRLNTPLEELILTETSLEPIDLEEIPF